MVFLARFLRFFAFFIILILFAMPKLSYTCPVCFGAPDSPLTEGMNMAILTLLGIIGTILGMFAAFFIYLRNRAKQYPVSSIQ